MSTTNGAPLTYVSSADAHPAPSRSLPPEVITCLQNARFLHLATCIDQVPHISLMNYTYLPTSPFSSYPTIVMTTQPSSKKTLNLLSNPRVALLVHDWVSHRPPTQDPNGSRERSPPPQGTQSSLATLLLNMNTSALSRISVAINGEARVVEEGSREEKWCKENHLRNNTFQDADGGRQEPVLGSSPADEGRSGDGGRGWFIENEDVRVVVVRIRDGRVADWKGEVRDWAIEDDAGGGERMVNGL